MTSGYKLFLTALLLSFPVLSQAQTYSREQYISLIEEYVGKVANIYDGTWAYSYTTEDRIDDESLTRRIDPSLPFLESDRIISENGGPPSTERLERHERRMQRRLHRRQEAEERRSIVDEEKEKEGSEKDRFLALFIPDSLKLVRQEGSLHYLEFRGMEDDRAKIYKHLVGTLVLDTEKEFIRELQVRVTEPFSPFLFTRINDAYFSLRFELRNGVPVQTDATWQLDGNILYIRNLDRDEEVNWFDVTPLPAGNAG